VSGGNGESTQQAIVRALTRALEQELTGKESERGAPQARDVAQVLALDGLDRALSVCTGTDPAGEPLRQRILALAVECAASGRLEVFTRADADLDRLAAELGAEPVATAVEEAEPAEGSLKLSEALEDLPITGIRAHEIADAVRLTPQVAAALRAALDWLCETGAGARPLRLRSEDALLEIRCEAVAGEGIPLAAAVLATAGGNLGPSSGTAGQGSWTLRVPTVTGRATYLMVMQGDLPLALPWHSVLRMTMAPAGAVDSSIRSLGLPVLKPLSPLSTTAHEYPIVLVAHGLKRAYLVADQLVWRLPAEPVEVGAAVIPEAVAQLETDDGERYHLLDPARLLEEVQDPAYPAGPEPRRDVVDTPATTPAQGPAPAAANDSKPLPEAPAPAAPAAEVAPVAEDAPVQPVTPEVPPRRASRRILIADDSVAARITLSHMLEARGYEVTPVATAHELVEMLGAGTWEAVFVDIELPDARGRGLFDAVQRRAASLAVSAPLVAVVRDRGERELAERAGFAFVDKPFRTSQVDDLLRLLGGPRHDAR